MIRKVRAYLYSAYTCWLKRLGMFVALVGLGCLILHLPLDSPLLRIIFGITLKNGRNGIEWLSGKAFAKPNGDNGKNRVTQRKAEL